MILLLLMIAAPSDGSVKLEEPLAAYQRCISQAVERFAPLVQTSGPQSGIESEQVAERAVAACDAERKALKSAAVEVLRSKPEYRDRTDLEDQAEAALQPFDAMLKEDARLSALLAFGNQK